METYERPDIPVIDSNKGVIKTDPNLSTETVQSALQISNDLGIDVDPVKNFSPNEKLNTQISETSTATRQIANENDKSASLVKPEAENLNYIETLLKNSKIELTLREKRQASTALVIKKMKANRSDGSSGLTEQEELDLINVQEDIKELTQQRDALKLNTAESVISGDLVSVFNDIGQAAKESPWSTAAATTGGFLVGSPGGAYVGFSLATSVGNAQYQFEQATAETYQDLEDITDDLGNPIDDATKTAIALTSGTLQGGLELGTDVAALATLGVLGKSIKSLS